MGDSGGGHTVQSEEGEKQGLLASDSVAPVVKRPTRNKTGSRFYYAVLLLWASVLLLVAGISLGSFGLRQSKINNFYSNNSGIEGGHCILYVNFDHQNGSITYVKFPQNFGVCGFVFWALTSLVLVALSLVIYMAVLLCAGTRVLSGLRILEFVVSVITVLAAFVISIIITAGIARTCSALHRGNAKAACSASPLFRNNDQNQKMYFYNDIIVAQHGCWVSTVFWLVVSIWKFVVVIIYMKQRNKRKLNNEEEEGVV